LVLLQQGQQFEQGVPGESCARPRSVAKVSISGFDRDAKSQGTPIGHEDVAGALGVLADRKDREASAAEGVSGVGHLDYSRIELRWVLEGGIILLDRSIWSLAVGKPGLSC
jgi:hypothetical protein